MRRGTFLVCCLVVCTAALGSEGIGQTTGPSTAQRRVQTQIRKGTGFISAAQWTSALVTNFRCPCRTDRLWQCAGWPRGHGADDVRTTQRVDTAKCVHERRRLLFLSRVGWWALRAVGECARLPHRRVPAEHAGRCCARSRSRRGRAASRRAAPPLEVYRGERDRPRRSRGRVGGRRDRPDSAASVQRRHRAASTNRQRCADR